MPEQQQKTPASGFRGAEVVPLLRGDYYCGGTTDADVRDFVARWFDDPPYGETLRDSRFDELGFALIANCEGLKISLAVLADQRD